MKFNNRNVYISASAQIGKNVKIGDNTSIYDNVVIGDNCIISNNCTIGEPTASYYRDELNYINAPTYIGDGAMIRSNCIIYSGSTFGKNLNTGHNTVIREKTTVGDNCLISTMVDIQGNCSIGNYSRIYSNVHIAELTKIGNYVFIFPYTIFTNDPQPPSNSLVGAEVGDYSIITVHCSVLPGVKVGTHCLIGANSVISRDIEDNSFAIGSPAKKIRDTRDISSKEDQSAFHYPWPNNFDRGMPWQGADYNEWLNNK